ncbi:MAG TPA: hypothetical protein VFX84_03295, partial [Candidatus Saccharimonadales bacterium]|nr:hypothetical protein [Candidatus Saccharimonadales bacterium]
MGVKIRSKETRFLGWNAIQRATLADWFRERAARTPATGHKEGGNVKEPQENREDRQENQTSQGKTRSDGNGRSKKQEHKLEDAVEESHNVLANATTVFPFTLFPDTITIDRHKLTIMHRWFFGMGQAASVPIENIKNIQADLGPFFGSLTITSDHFVNNTQTLNYLHR